MQSFYFMEENKMKKEETVKNMKEEVIKVKTVSIKDLSYKERYAIRHQQKERATRELRSLVGDIIVVLGEVLLILSILSLYMAFGLTNADDARVPIAIAIVGFIALAGSFVADAITGHEIIRKIYKECKVTDEDEEDEEDEEPYVLYKTGSEGGQNNEEIV